MSNSSVVTIQRHIMEQQALHPSATGAFTRLLWDLVLAFKMISREVNRAGLANVLGSADRKNVQGEVVTKLDEFAEARVEQVMDLGGHLCCMVSEEADDVIPISPGHPRGKYVLLFDPLDGSKNTDANAPVGTIFSIMEKISPGEDGTIEDCLQPGSRQIAAGYVLYGPSTMLVYSAGRGVHGFTLDPSLGEFLLSHEDIRVPDYGSIYSVNEGNTCTWDRGTRRFVEHVKAPENGPFALRYIGALVADFHRTLLYGGIFLYPEDRTDPDHPKPKLRLLYEASPLAFIAEQAGGAASTGRERLLDIVPTNIHQRVAVALGGSKNIREYEDFVKAG